MFIEKLLTDKFYEILEKHNNERWTVNELEWLVYDVHRSQYDKLNDNDKYTVDKVFSLFRKNYGNKLLSDI